MREFTIHAPAKLNLYLDVLDKRTDGYHNIKTLFEKIDLKDEITIREKHKGVYVRVEPPALCPSGKDNIVYSAVKALLKEAGVNLGLEIIIKKNIPVSSGLGGGSSDAAATLRSINEKFNLGVSRDSLFSIAAHLGKDVPFFMLDTSFAIGSSAGDSLEPVDTDFGFAHVVIKPDISISTAEMYKRLDGRPQRSKDHSIEKIVFALEKRDLSLLQNSYYNIFEEVLSDYSPHIDKAKTLLLKANISHCFLSGTGPSVFCTLEDREEAMGIYKRIPREEGMTIFLATTLRSFSA